MKVHITDRSKLFLASAFILAFAAFGILFFISAAGDRFNVSADENRKDLKWTKQAIEEGTTVNAEYLWPDEINPEFTSVYRGGEKLSDEKMITLTKGSVYHFRGKSENSILYTEVYVGSTTNMDVMSSEIGMWYGLLPSAIKKTFETDGWKIEESQEYTDRASIDFNDKHILVNENTPSAVLYGMGLYLNKEHDYHTDKIFVEEEERFKELFGSTDDMFAAALEQYYTKGGKLRSECPGIYEMVANVIAGLDVTVETMQTRINVSNTDPILNIELLKYVNNKRTEIGLEPVIWNEEDNENIIIRTKEVAKQFSQIRPDGTDAFTAYSDTVMCETRLMDADGMEGIFENTKTYFLKEDMKSFNCAVYGNIAVLIFTW